MPEAFTYYDMQRRIAAQIPAATYQLQFHRGFFGALTMRDEHLLGDFLGPSLMEEGPKSTALGKPFEFTG